MNSGTGMQSLRFQSIICSFFLTCCVSSESIGNDTFLLRGRTKGTNFVGKTRMAEAINNDFYGSCSSALLSEEVTEDGIISQNDFCAQYTPDCEGGFTSLPVQVQLVFVQSICPIAEGAEEQLACFQSLGSLERSAEFGYHVNSGYPNIDPETQVIVDNMCIGLVEFMTAPGNEVETTEEPVTETTAPTQVETTSDPSPQSDETQPPSATESDTPAPSSTLSPDSSPGGIQSSGTVQEDATTSSENPDSDDGLGTWPIVGIAAAGAVCLVLFAFVVGRRQEQNVEQHKPLEILEGSFSSEHTPDLNFTPGMDAMADTGDNSSRSSSRSGNINARITQFDPCSASSTGHDGGVRDSRTSLSPFNRQNSSSGLVSVDMLNEAIDAADWDKVYEIASQLAEQEDSSTLSSAGKGQPLYPAPSSNRRTRSHLSPEDQERTKVLDGLVESRDWTGVAVTAALYAGESDSSRGKSSSRRTLNEFATGKKMTSKAAAIASKEDVSSGIVSARTHPQASPKSAFESSTALGELKDKIDRAVDSNDWECVLLLSSEIERNETFRACSSLIQAGRKAKSQTTAPDNQRQTHTMASLKQALDVAVKHGDWISVGFYADQIRNASFPAVSNDNSAPTSSIAMIPLPPSPSFSTSNEFDTSTASKRQTIEKLIKAKKWKGVSIMAGLYEMESRESDAGSSSPAPGWTGLVNLSKHLDETPTKSKTPRSTPRLSEREEVKLRTIGSSAEKVGK